MEFPVSSGRFQKVLKTMSLTSPPPLASRSPRSIRRCQSVPSEEDEDLSHDIRYKLQLLFTR